MVTAVAVSTPEWLYHTFLDVEVWKYLAILGLLLGAQIARHLAEMILGRYFRALTRRAGLASLAKTIERADRALGFLAFAVIIYFAVPLLELPRQSEAVIRIAARALIAVGGVWLAFRVLDVLFDYLAAKAELTASKLDDQVIPMLRRVAKVFTAVIGTLFVLQNMEVNIGSLLAGLGLGGLAFALAAKDTVANFFGSMVIFVDKPFTIGDWVVIGGEEGIVEEVGFRTTRVRTFQNSLLTVPNATLTTATIDNFGARRYRRYSTKLGITYDTPPEKVQAFCEGIRAITTGMPQMRKDSYFVEFHGFADFSLSILLYCFMDTPTWAEELRVRSQLNLEILRLADRLGVRFAFPTSSLHVESLVAPGTLAPRPAVPPVDELTGTIRAFGPGGELARPRGLVLAGGFDPPPPGGALPRGAGEGDG
jgi:MscS family membrane protein